MAIVKKGKKGVEKPGYPSRFVSLVEKAATLQTTAAFFDAEFGVAKSDISDYLNEEDCPVQVRVGEKGGNPKVDGIATVIVSQPERLDNKAAAQLVATLVGEGKINAADLAELISQVNKDALSKVVDPATLASLVKKDETGEVALQISIRADNAFKASVTEKLTKNVRPVVNGTVDIPVVQPSAAPTKAEADTQPTVEA